MAEEINRINTTNKNIIIMITGTSQVVVIGDIYTHIHLYKLYIKSINNKALFTKLVYGLILILIVSFCHKIYMFVCNDQEVLLRLNSIVFCKECSSVVV